MLHTKLGTFALKHRISILDLSMLMLVMLVATYICYEVDIFVAEGATSQQDKSIELDEALMLGGMLAVGMLIFSIRRYIEQKRETSRRIAAESHARELAYQDPLTGLANRRQFEEALSRAAASLPAAGQSHAVMILDLNGFKQINDTYGHAAGDEVLLCVAGLLLSAVREGDLVARLGGDEFIVLARHLMGPEAAANIASRIIASLDKPVLAGRTTHRVASGIGIALIPGDARDGAEALRMADLALYRSKGERRSAFRFFEEDMDALTREREALERRLHAALREGAIKPRFRPSLDLASGRIIGFEATPAWFEADVEVFPPERFLPIAEETGLIHDLAAHVFEEACLTARHWPNAIVLSVDVLPVQIKDRELGENMLRTLRQTGLSPQRLEVDIPESAVVNDLGAAKLSLQPLRQAGAHIALDNFGTGYSNLYHIREFGFDKVKIDKRFVANLDSEDASSVVRALAGLGQGLGVSVSAEGFERDSDTAALLASGVNEGQHSSHSVSASASVAMCKTQSIEPHE